MPRVATYDLAALTDMVATGSTHTHEGAIWPMPANTAVVTLIGSFLTRAKKPFNTLEPETALYNGGLELTSLDAAELSAVLEDELGSDPFSSGEVPATIGDIIAFYG